MARRTTKAAKRSTRAAPRRAQAAKKSTRKASTKRSTARKPARRAAREPKSLHDLFHETLKDIYHAEKQILRALPKMAKAANSDELRAAFEKHRGETEGQVDRLEQVFQILGAPPKAKPCHAIMGLVEEGQEVMEEFGDSDALDAGLLAGAQAVEHYEISRYGTMIAWAQHLGLDDAVPLLEETLEQEKATDSALTELAEASVNSEGEEEDFEERRAA